MGSIEEEARPLIEEGLILQVCSISINHLG
jgi:hypothetical protein